MAADWTSLAQLARGRERLHRCVEKVVLQQVDPRFGPCIQRFDRVEVIADGLHTLWQGAHPGHRHDSRLPFGPANSGDGSARPKSGRPQRSGSVLDSEAQAQLETTYPELALNAEGRARLVVLAAEVGDHRWSNETSQFLRGLAKARAETVPMILQERAKAAWLRRWSSLLACSMVRAFSESLVERRPVPCTGNVPSIHEVIREDRFS